MNGGKLLWITFLYTFKLIFKFKIIILIIFLLNAYYSNKKNAYYDNCSKFIIMAFNIRIKFYILITNYYTMFMTYTCLIK